MNIAYINKYVMLNGSIDIRIYFLLNLDNIKIKIILIINVFVNIKLLL